jgi:hypothetical protein
MQDALLQPNSRMGLAFPAGTGHPQSTWHHLPFNACPSHGDPIVALAIFQATLAQYLRDSAGGAGQQNPSIAIATDQRGELLQAAGSTRIDALVADLALPGDVPEKAIAELEAALKPERTLIAHALAKWEVVGRLRHPNPVADLVVALNAFEADSAQCQKRTSRTCRTTACWPASPATRARRWSTRSRNPASSKASTPDRSSA